MSNIVADLLQQDQVEHYSMDQIQERLNLDRSKLIAMAALLGCDFYEGVSKIGKEKAMQFLKNYKDKDAMNAISR